MPQLARITSTFFTNLITRLGIRPPFSEGFEMSNVVTPVSIVDSDITLQAITTSILLAAPYTAGSSATPAAGTVLADTGAQSAGNYVILVTYGADFAVSVNTNAFEIQRRDAANAANIWTIMSSIAAGSQGFIQSLNVTLALNERIRVVQYQNSPGSNIKANVWIAPTA